MTLDEAIKHCDEVIEKEDCSKCAKEHEQLKEWLEELKELKNPQPYKFEDLKPHMFVFDKDFNGWGEILRIVETSVNEYGEKIVKCLATGDSSLQTRSYKENRFFPVTKAMQYQNNK